MPPSRPLSCSWPPQPVTTIVPAQASVSQRNAPPQPRTRRLRVVTLT